MKKRLFPILMAVLMMFAMMAVTAWAEGYTLTLDQNYQGGTVESFDNCSTYVLPELTRRDYTHKGWSTASEPGTGGETWYDIGSTVDLNQLNRSLTLYAQWESDYYNVIFKAGDGTGDDQTVNIRKGSEYEIPSASSCGFYKTQYALVGWAEKKNGEVVYQPGQKVVFNSNKTLYAVWDIAALDDITPYHGDNIWFAGNIWRVIGHGDNDEKALLISNDVIGGAKDWMDSMAYCETLPPDLFSSKEKDAVLYTSKEELKYGANYTEFGLNKARLFLLSKSETDYFFSDDEYRKTVTGKPWWTRSVAGASASPYQCSYVVLGDGSYVIVLNTAHEDDTGLGARPAFVLNQASVLFTSAAEGVKASATADGSSFGAFRDGGDGDKKLTLFDGERRGFSADAGGADNITAQTGGTAAISYRGAITGENEYVSAMLCDCFDDVLGYAGISPEAATGTWNVTLPALTDGVYKLKVFSEQRNGDRITDYASPMSEITLNVGDVSKFAVVVNPGAGMSKTADSGDAKQSGLSGAMKDVVYTADSGYYFPADYSVSSVNGVSVTLNSNTQITVSGMPTANTEITLPDAVPVDVFTVTFKAEGGTWTDGTTADKEVTVEKGKEATAPADPTREGFIFDGWDTDFRSVTSDLTVTAKWIKVYTVTVNNGDGDGEYAADASVTITANAPVQGKQFKEWTGDVDKVTFTEGSKTTSTAKFKMPAEALTFEATYEDIPAPPVETFNVTFKAEGGTWTDGTTADKEVTVEKGKDATAPAAPTREGFTFDGWDKDFSRINYDMTVKAKWKVKIQVSDPPAPVSIQNAKVTLSKKSFVYNGKVQKPTIKAIGGKTLTAGTDYTVTWSNASSRKAGTYTVTITGKGNYTGTTKATYKINKAANPLSVKGRTASVKFKKLKKKAQTLKVSKVMKFTKKGQGRTTYKLVSAKKGSKSFRKYFKVDKKTGKVTLKKVTVKNGKVTKGLKKGKYKVRVKVEASGNANYKAKTKAVTFTIDVK